MHTSHPPRNSLTFCVGRYISNFAILCCYRYATGRSLIFKFSYVDLFQSYCPSRIGPGSLYHPRPISMCRNVRAIDRSPYARRHQGGCTLWRYTGMAFENQSKLEVGYPVSPLICKLQEIRRISLARQQQHPFFSSLACVYTYNPRSNIYIYFFPFFIFICSIPLVRLAAIHSARAFSL